MNKSESKYFNTAKKMDKALISLLEEKSFEGEYVVFDVETTDELKAGITKTGIKFIKSGNIGEKVENSGFVGYVKEGFSHEDLVKLKEVCDKLVKKGCYVLVSNNDTEFVRQTFNSSDYEIIYSNEC